MVRMATRSHACQEWQREDMFPNIIKRLQNQRPKALTQQPKFGVKVPKKGKKGNLQSTLEDV
ncbi:hypothetical protein BVRB_8g187280 [Beta vulgaris subsp. vulgaris]|nr:hypothetical protein BVRB_8g187280 [Beta vulgaris subsp. vulgaris]